MALIYQFNNIAKITVDFSDEFEMFDASISHEALKVMIKGQRVSKLGYHEIWMSIHGFGNFIATGGRLYHWTIKTINGSWSDGQLNIGITEADEWKESLKNQNWWKGFGYSYYIIMH